MKNICLLIFIFLSFNTRAQNDETILFGESDIDKFQTATKTIEVYTSSFAEGSLRLDQFLKNYRVVINKSNKTEVAYEVIFKIDLKYLQAVDSLASKLGYATQNSYNTQNMGSEIINLQQKIKRMEINNKSVDEELRSSVLNESEKSTLRNHIRNNNSIISDLKFRMDEINNNTKAYHLCEVNFKLHDEITTPENSRISFVNMPGFEYNYLFIENPKVGLSASLYQGIGVKYMFTRGKSYFNLGVYKAVNNNKTDSTLIRDMFNIQFGQDFYPKHFGRGKRKFLNLYTGYQAGGFIATRNNDISNGFTPLVNLIIGVELFKSKHILIDNKASYFLPLSDLNRNLRGINYGVSLNFVF